LRSPFKSRIDILQTGTFLTFHYVENARKHSQIV
jgi:hypothetical protein